MTEYPTREAFLEALPKNGVIAEIGVFRGHHAVSMFNICQPTELVLVDPWKNAVGQFKYKWANMNQMDLEILHTNVVNHFRNTPSVKVVRKGSLDAAVDYPDHYFDWVYIDANHEYEPVMKDLKAWFPKIKKGGYLCGHDYSDAPRILAKGDGVFFALNDLCEEHGLEVNFDTSLVEERCFAVNIK